MEANSGAGGTIAVELAEHVERGDEADEAEAHDEHHRRRDLEAGGVVGVEPQHIASAGAGAAADRGGAGSSAEAATAHAGSGGSGAARSHHARSRGGVGRCGLRLRGASRHVDDHEGKGGGGVGERNSVLGIEICDGISTEAHNYLCFPKLCLFYHHWLHLSTC